MKGVKVSAATKNASAVAITSGA